METLAGYIKSSLLDSQEELQEPPSEKDAISVNGRLSGSSATAFKTLCMLGFIHLKSLTCSEQSQLVTLKVLVLVISIGL